MYFWCLVHCKYSFGINSKHQNITTIPSRIKMIKIADKDKNLALERYYLKMLYSGRNNDLLYSTNYFWQFRKEIIVYSFHSYMYYKKVMLSDYPWVEVQLLSWLVEFWYPVVWDVGRTVSLQWMWWGGIILVYL